MAQTLHYNNHHTLNIVVDSQAMSTTPSSTIMTDTDIPQYPTTNNVKGQEKNVHPTLSQVVADERLHQDHRQRGSTNGDRVNDGRSTPQNASKKRAEVEWTSFTHDSEAEDTPESRRRFSESEHRNLLADDYDQLSEDDDPESCSPPRQPPQNSQPCTSSSTPSTFEITPQLKQYYCEQFEKLYKIVNGGKVAKKEKNLPQNYDNNHCEIEKNREFVGAAKEDDLGLIAKRALKGTDPRVQEFFRKSKLDQSQLSKIWSLADVNTDGYLNLHEFIVAMHLIVRHVKGKCEIPDELPIEFRPAITPPRFSDDENDQESDWASMAPSQQLPPTPAVAAQSSRASSKQEQKFIQEQQPPPTQFTSQPPSQSAHISHPVARRFSPDVPPKKHLKQQQHVVLLSPQTLNPPKGPPPKPPPRPPVQTRHTRSVSLDLNKNRFSPPEALQPEAADLKPVAHEGSTNRTISERSDAETQTDQHYQSDTISASSNDPAMTTSSLLIDESSSDPMTTARTPSDRCQLLKTTNDQFERELARLVEIRLKLQTELKHFENSSGINLATKN